MKTHIIFYVIIHWINAEDEVVRNSQLNITEIYKKYGYPTETHEIETADGYLLTMFRIPHGHSFESSQQKNKTPILLVHGLLGCSENFMYLGPNKSLSYLLADKGYDVWLANVRGNMHSRKHKVMDPDKDLKFWYFSWHEIGIYDLPAMIDYVLEKSGHSSLYYMGHSQGTTSFFVMTSTRPEYNRKIKLMIALAPVAFLKHFRISYLRYLSRFYLILDRITWNMGIVEILPLIKTRDFHYFLKTFCGKKSVWRQFCIGILRFLTGPESEQFNEELIEFILNSVPAGAGLRQALHYGQSIHNGMFEFYDFGAKKNLKKYKSKKPPPYNLANITAPIAFIWGDNDDFATEPDITRLAKYLPSLVENYRVTYDNFTHFDFIWGKDALHLCYDKVFQLLKNSA